MDETMTHPLVIEAEWETLRHGAAEECACFAALGIRYGDLWLTEAEDAFVNRLRTKVHLSAYHFAEWLAWNWWRLRWEPRKPGRPAPDWGTAHRMASIGGGYVWPNITIFSDGERVVLLAKPTRPHPAAPLRYLADFAAIVRASEFERAVGRFVDQVRGQLRAEGITDSNLDRIWGDVVSERQDKEASAFRRIEALLGSDPDEGDESAIRALLADEHDLGAGAVAEVAASGVTASGVLTAERLRTTAAASGFDVNQRDVVSLAPGTLLAPIGEGPAWRRGVDAAHVLREQQRLGSEPISNDRLAQMAAVAPGVLTDDTRRSAEIAFVLDEASGFGRLVLRSKWESGRRFELARLIGDRLTSRSGGRLFPATQTHTYRQKVQRSFAAELLCPFESLEGVLGSDYSQDAIEDAAKHFNVSSMTVETLLDVHGRLERENLDRDFETMAA